MQWACMEDFVFVKTNAQLYDSGNNLLKQRKLSREDDWRHKNIFCDIVNCNYITINTGYFHWTYCHLYKKKYVNSWVFQMHAFKNKCLFFV